MNSELLVLNFSLLKTVGEISEKKINLFINEGYELVSTVSEQMALFKDPNTGYQILIGQNQVTLGVDSNTMGEVMKNLHLIQAQLEKILDTLLLDNKVVLEVVVEKKYLGENDTFQQSLNTLNSDYRERIIEIGGKSVALRVPIQYENYNGEIRFEPFFKEPGNYFLSSRMLTNGIVSVEDCTDFIREILSYINQKAEPMLKFIFARE